MSIVNKIREKIKQANEIKVGKDTISGTDIIDGKYFFKGFCGQISDGLCNTLNSYANWKIQNGISKIHVVRNVFKDANIHPNYYGKHAYLVCESNNERPVIIDVSVDNYKKKNEVFIGTPKTLRKDLKKLLEEQPDRYNFNNSVLSDIEDYYLINQYIFNKDDKYIHNNKNLEKCTDMLLDGHYGKDNIDKIEATYSKKLNECSAKKLDCNNILRNI